MTQHNVLITGSLHPSAQALFAKADDVSLDYRPDLPFEQILPIIGNYHALVTRSETKIDSELIDAAPNLKVISRAAVGISNIDVDYATDKGILVLNTPGKNTNSAAELTMGLLLSVMRNISRAHATMQAGGWDRHKFSGRELMGKTIGIIGLGNVGHRVARFARAFDMTVLAYDPYIADEQFDRHHAHRVNLEELVARSDVITVHTPLNRETRDLLNAPHFSRMKDGVIVLNAARGGIINEEALLEGLNSGKVAGAGLDVYSKEPAQDSPFADLPQVVCTPHIGASTEEAQQRIAETVVEQTLRALRDEVVDYPVNMPRLQVLTSPRVKTYAVLAEKLGAFCMQSLDFNPRKIEVTYRGELTSDEGMMVRRAFLKGFLHSVSEETVTFVNAEQKAAERQITIEDVDDPGFSDYPSAVKFTVTDHEREYQVGGVVFGEGNYRLTYVDGFTFEVIPEGDLLYIINQDRPGVIGDIGTTLARGGVNINQFELSRNMPGGKAMALIRVDELPDRETLEALRGIANMLTVRAIRI